jgi:hypothetical protein
MPQVPIQTTPTTQLGVEQMPAFAAPEVRPMQNGAPQQMQEAGKAMMSAGVDAMRIGQRIQDDIDDAAVAKGINGLTEELSNSTIEYGQKKGEAAVNGLGEFEDHVNSLVEQYVGGLANSTQEKLFRAKSDILARTARTNAYAHREDQLTKVTEASTDAEIDSWTRAAAMARNPDDVTKFQAAAAVSLDRKAVQLGIAKYDTDGKETSLYRELYQEKIGDKLGASKISMFLADGDYKAADEYLQTNKDDMSLQVYTKLYDTVTTARDAKGGIDIGNAAFEGGAYDGASSQPKTPAGANPPHMKFRNKDELAGYGNMAPEFRTAMENVAAEYFAKTGKELQVNYTFRTKEHQEDVYARSQRDGFVAAKPGVSRHQTQYDGGQPRAVDIDASQSRELEKLGILKANGLENLGRVGDVVHVQFTDRNRGRWGKPSESLDEAIRRVKSLHLSPDMEKSALAQVHHRYAEREAVKNQGEKDNWDLASSMIQTGKMTPQQFAVAYPAVWNSIKTARPDQAAVLQQGRVTGDDTDTMVRLITDTSWQNPTKVGELWRSGLISREKYMSYMAAFSEGGKLSDDKIRSVQGFTDQFNAELIRSGFGSYVDGTKINKQQKSQFIELKAEFDAAVTEQQRAQKRQLDWTDQQAVLQRILRNKVAVDGWGGSVKPVFQLKQDELGKAYVMYGDKKVFLSSIPATDRAQIIAALASRGNYSPSETDIVSYYMRNKNRKK